MIPDTIAALNAVAQRKEFCEYILQNSPHLQSQLTALATAIYREQIESPLEFDPRLVEVDVDNATLEQLFSLVSQQWTHYGEVAPFHSVLTSDEYHPSNITASRVEELYATGANEVALLKQLSERAGIDLNSKQHCFELGCGVGRVTMHLACEFQKVTAYDISPGNLRLCAKKIKEQNIRNVELTQITHVRDLENIGPIDAFFSRIVLQHNSPPVQKFMLETVLKSLTAGGVALFQTVVGGKGYGYSARRHLAQAVTTSGGEMHALPAKHIFDIFRNLNFRVLDVFKELAGGFNVASYTFFAQKG
jgi:2-polyprenyl-3-methyl-5-hydroxy-6-metoxy-1,4-benzoquinol methylase